MRCVRGRALASQVASGSERWAPPRDEDSRREVQWLLLALHEIQHTPRTFHLTGQNGADDTVICDQRKGKENGVEIKEKEEALISSQIAYT